MTEIKRKKTQRLPNERNLSDSDRAILSKLVRRNEYIGGGDEGTSDKRTFKNLDLSTINNLATGQAQRNIDAENIFQVLPEMNLAKEILISLVTSPDELVETDLIYSIEDSEFDDGITGPLLRAVQKRFNVRYKIKDLVTDMVGDVLFDRGSYPLLVLPESSIDQLINSDVRVSIESIVSNGYGDLQKSLNLLGSGKEADLSKPALERLTSKRTLEPAEREIDDLFITVIDSPDIMKTPSLISKLTEDTVKAAIEGLRPALEAHPKIKERPTLKSTEHKFYPKRAYDVVPTDVLLTPKQITDGVNKTAPVLIHLQSDSVIRVFVPGNVRQLIGAFLLIDADGNSLSVSSHQNYFNDIRNTMKKKSGASSRILEQVQQSYGGGECNSIEDMRRMTEAYSTIVEDELLNRLRSGAMTGNYELAHSDEVMRFMMARTMSKKRTNLLYVPRELLIYFAIDYNHMGFGKSLLEDGKLLASLRATMLFSDIHSAIKNATGTQTIRINVPEKSGNPFGDVKDMLNFYHELNSDSLPYASIHPRDITTYLAKAGKNVVVTGNAAFPEVGFEVDERAGVYKEGNSELSDTLKKNHINSFLLTPELLDAADSADFAQQVKDNNVFLNKRIIKIQNKLNPEITRLHRLIINNDGHLRIELEEILKGKKKLLTSEQKTLLTNPAKITELIETFTKSLSVNLPRPNVSNITDHKERIEEYAELVEAVYNYSFNDEIFVEDQTGELQEAIEPMRKAFVAAAVRKFMVENNICPEINNLTAFEEEDGLLDSLTNGMFRYNENVIKNLGKFMKKITKAGAKRMEVEEEEEPLDDETPEDDGQLDEQSEDSDQIEDDDQLVEESEDDDFEMDSEDTDGTDDVEPDEELDV